MSAYEMRNRKENAIRRETTFKASNKKGNKQIMSKSCFDEYDDVEENFVEKLKRGHPKIEMLLAPSGFSRTNWMNMEK